MMAADSELTKQLSSHTLEKFHKIQINSVEIQINWEKLEYN